VETLRSRAGRSIHDGQEISMHPAAKEFVRRYATERPVSVVEIGSRDINGSLRPLFPNAAPYTGLDLFDGAGVDLVTDACDWFPPEKVDIVLCCEVLEHSEKWQDIVASAAMWLKPGGRLVLTFANPLRHPHSMIDGGDLRIGEYYRGLWPDSVCPLLYSAECCVTAAEIYGADSYVAALYQPH